MTAASSFGTAVYVVAAMSVAGVAHALWLRSALARAWSARIDFGMLFKGKPLFGENKKIRGFVVMPPATALTFVGINAQAHRLPDWLAAGIWPMSRSDLAVLGFAAGLGFMLAELPNSFIKRQLEVAPGKPASGGGLRSLFLVVDRIDSVLGTLLAIDLFAPVAAMTWLWVLLLGIGAHGAFSVLLYWSGVKSRPL